MVAVAVEISRGMKRGTERSISSTSTAKTTPAIGLLKIAAIPDAEQDQKRIVPHLPDRPLRESSDPRFQDRRKSG